MNLIKQNEQAKKSSKITVLAGIILAAAVMALTLAYSSIMYYIDFPTLILLGLAGAACVLISGKRTYREILEILKKTAFPNGIFVTAASLVMVLHDAAEEQHVFWANIGVICITLVYAAVEYLVVLLLLERTKNHT